MEKIEKSNIDKIENKPISAVAKLIAMTALLTLYWQNATAQNTISPELQKKREELSWWDRDNHTHDIFKCLINNDIDIHKTDDHNIQLRDPLYTDCDTVRIYDVIIDNKTRVDGYKYENKIDSTYAADGINIKNINKSTMPITSDIVEWMTSKNTIAEVWEDVGNYIRNWSNTIPKSIQDTLDYIKETYRPDILNIIVPRGVWWPSGVSGQPQRDHNTEVATYIPWMQLIATKNSWRDKDDPSSTYYKWKAHEIWHTLNKWHPDENRSNIPGRETDPLWNWYMVSNINGATTWEDKNINKHLADISRPFLLKMNEMRESDCFTVSITHPDKNEVDITLYPNPTNNIINIEDDGNYIEWRRATLINSIWNKIDINKEENSIKLDQLPTGVYYLQLPLKTGKVKVASIIKN